MVMCYHPSCVKSGKDPIKFRRAFNLDDFLFHLEDHVDEVGEALQLRFSAIKDNPFSSKVELDSIASAPSELIQNSAQNLNESSLTPHLDACIWHKSHHAKVQVLNRCG